MGCHYILPNKNHQRPISTQKINLLKKGKNLFILLNSTLELLFFKFLFIKISMKIKAYLKPHCGWSMGVRAIMEKYSLQFEDLDIINNREIYAEMVEKSGQPLSPCVEVDGVMLSDVSGEEVENYLLSNQLVKESSNTTDVPTNSPCSDEEHERQAREAQEGSPVRFF
jgi:monothiol glutaredoxin